MLVVWVVALLATPGSEFGPVVQMASRRIAFSLAGAAAFAWPGSAVAYGGLPERKGRIARTCSGSADPACAPSSSSKTLSELLDEQVARSDPLRVECQSASQCSKLSGAVASPAPARRKPENGPMQFHEGTEERVVRRVLARAAAGDPRSVLDTVDAFCNSEHWMMNIGPAKGAFVDRVMQQVRPMVMVELGTYVGYSTVRWAAQLPAGGRLWSVDPEPASQESASLLLRRAGLEDLVTLVRGQAEEAIPRLKRELGGRPIDVLFIDHVSAKYLPDLQRFEAAGLLRDGSVVAADNVLFFATSDYLQHVRSSGLYRSSTTYTATLEYSEREAKRDPSLVDGVEVSVYSGSG